MFTETETGRKSCAGTVFKADVQNYRTGKGGFGFSVRLVPVKRLACPGCEACWWQSEAFSEVNNDWPIANIETAEHGELYEIGVCNIGTDRETGQVDEWDLELIPYEGASR
jgi:hypothetical protein